MSSSLPPVDVVCAVIRRGDLILLAKRPPGKRLAGMWEFPGGKVDPGETPDQALHREIMEELGCELTILQAGPAALHEYEWGSIRLFPFLCELKSESSEPCPHEHSELIWVFQKKLSRPDMAPADEPVIRWVATLA
ncbi:8-oxo-dGTP diphosphatase [Prosthecobacter fusiformis]|uniref:8-oxo-dGTP diphosphatase n=1 Tax=Prosthecobacter fusiformis TaxID=48464 RepID=A0A4R7SQ02_9BACT|nr:(deoxy)nucleoside triphosphate pyrophosphohydrolase [Prosthecobacter fusiformis]TDU81091.1 8-oxo-dGTP diphosphatase [Prosthecobacter fusiformis]